MRETLATILWEGWTALVLCAAAVFLPGSEALTYPAVLWPGLVLAAAVPAGWVFWALAEQPAPLPPEQLLANAIILQAVNDYRARSDKRTIGEIERFFRSEWFAMLTKLDGEALLEKLREEKCL